MTEKELYDFCKFLEKLCYMDTDWREEKPTAVERYLKKLAAENNKRKEK